MTYTYAHSKILDMRIAISEDRKTLWTEDKVKYTESELSELSKISGISKQAHQVKKIFGGEIVKCEVL